MRNALAHAGKSRRRGCAETATHRADRQPDEYLRLRALQSLLHRIVLVAVVRTITN